MNTKFTSLILLLLLSVGLLPVAAQAAESPASGMPGNAWFGYGVRVDLQGPDALSAIRLSGKVNIDWVAVEFDWDEAQPKASYAPHWGALDTALKTAADNDIAVMISITHAPSWAMKQNGPDPQATADLASKLVRRYPNALLALELFPHANTRQGWGAIPNPQAYAKLLKVTSQAVHKVNPQIVLVAGGLTPVRSSTQAMSDTTFLDGLYRAGAAQYMPVVGLRLPPIGDDPLTPREKSNRTVLRHYEAVREVMVRNGHRNGLIWVTSFTWNAGALRSAEKQANWLEQSYLLMRQQLYIGAAFFDSLNPSPGRAVLLPSRGGYHPGFDNLVTIIAKDHNGQSIVISPDFYKQTFPKNQPKDR